MMHPSAPAEPAPHLDGDVDGDLRPFVPGQLAIVELDGPVLTDDDARWIERHGVRAVCLFSKNLVDAAQSAALVRDLAAVMGPGALIAIDQEGGTVVRTRFGPHPPSALALGAVNDEALAEAVGAGVGRSLRALGVNWVLAPVLDLATDRHNPVTALRSFGDDPQAVIRLARAWMRGALAEGVACCGKHFPGHGSTSVDSHVGLPRVERSRAQLDALELQPFRALAAELPSLMTAHIVFPSIDAHHPVTLSPLFLRRLLRQEWRYPGVIVTDSLWMDGIRVPHGLAAAAVGALAAGADLVALMGPRAQQEDALQAMQRAFDDRTLSRAEGLRSRARLDALARRFPAGTAGAMATVGTAPASQDAALMDRAWAQALACRGGAVPPRHDAPLRVVLQRRSAGDGISEPGPGGEAVRALFDGFTDVQFVEVEDLRTLDWTTLPADGRQGVLVSSARTRSRRRVPLQGPDLHLVLWNPFEADEVAAPAVISWGPAEPALRALRHWLWGRPDAT